jgi:light-regulated signal transduction histidine kinase (bacteriophytochrome)
LRQGQGIIALLTDPSVGGQLVRRLLPITIFVPLLIGWLVIHGGNAGWFEPALGVAFSWGLLSLCLAGLILHQGLILYRHDHQQQHAAQDRERLLAELQQTIARLDQANMDLKQQSVALEQANTTLQQFARIASHDLQEPLLSIGEFVKLLQETYHGQLDEQADDWIERTVESVTWMQSMIRGLLTYARLDSQARPFEPISLGAIVQQVTEVLAATMVDTQAKLTCDELPTVLGDQTQLIQLILNLISNSLTFRTDQPPRIHLSAERQPTEWVIAVQDNGIGIAPRHQERIFEVFQRLHARHKYPGAGLGLAISRRVVERHGGRIWVESDVGQGSTFYFTMPLMSGDQAAS